LSNHDEKSSLKRDNAFAKEVTEEPGFKSSTFLDEEENLNFEALAGKDIAHFITEG